MNFMGDVKEIGVALPHPALPGSDWADAYQVVVERPFETAREAGDAIVLAFPTWTYPALALRQVLVLPFGLKGTSSSSAKKDAVGIFPVCYESPDELVAGFHDKHLNFRIIISLATREAGQAVTLTTAIKRHNFLGRTYLQAVLPFHRQIIRSALAKLARSRM